MSKVYTERNYIIEITKEYEIGDFEITLSNDIEAITMRIYHDIRPTLDKFNDIISFIMNIKSNGRLEKICELTFIYMSDYFELYNGWSTDILGYCNVRPLAILTRDDCIVLLNLIKDMI